MLKSYLILTYRNLRKSKAFSLINILGLSIGMAACILIASYVIHELSYDNFLDKKSLIYRVQLDRYDKGVLSTQWAAGCSAVGQALAENFPEVETYVRMRPAGGVYSRGDVFFNESKAYFASEDFFKVFTVQLLEGQDTAALNRPFTMAVSQSTAKKYFGDEDPVGKSLKANGGDDYEITAVFADFPENSQMKPDILVSFSTFVKYAGEQVLTAWQWDGFWNYVLLKPRTDAKALEAKLPAFVDKTVGDQLKQYDAGMTFHLIPITDVHLDSNYIMEFEANGNRMSVYFLIIIAVFIMVIAWINYVNLSTARSLERAKEVGLRKAMGSQRIQLVRQFLFESSVLNVIAFVVALALVLSFAPSFDELSGRQLGLTVFAQGNFWILFVLVFVIGSALAGLYPAFVLSGYQPVTVLKGKFSGSSRGLYLRKGLVVFQFMATAILLIGTFTVYRQITFMRNQELGAAINQTLVLRSPSSTDSTYKNKFDYFKNEVLREPGVLSVTASSSVPGERPGWNAGGIHLVTETSEQSKQYRVIAMDYDFVEAFGLETVAGRSFSHDYPNDQSSIMMNESAVNYLGFDNPEDVLDKDLFFWGDTFRIVGVIKDYHQESLKRAFEPLLFRCIPDIRGYYSVKVNTSNVHGLIGKVEEQWKTAFPGNPFDYFFLDEYYNNQYKADQQFGKVVGLFSVLAVLIACLGLFGLSSLMAVQRTKEIGVRKALGASTSGILVLMTRGYLVLVIISIVMAVPVAWLAMSTWLNEFAYHIDLSWWVFLLPAMGVTVIALGTIAYRTIQAAHTNPARSLRYE